MLGHLSEKNNGEQKNQPRSRHIQHKQQQPFLSIKEQQKQLLMFELFMCKKDINKCKENFYLEIKKT